MPVPIPKRSPWTNQWLVISALLYREAVTRFGRYKMGVFWMLTEPLISVIVIGLVLGPIVGRTAPDMPYAFFLLNGFVLYQTFMSSMMSGMNAIDSNRGLLVFPKVQPLDLLIARFLFELGTSMMSFIVFCLIGMWFGIQLSLGSLHILLVSFIMTGMLGSGLGLILCVASAFYESAEKMVAFIKRPMIFMCCVLYPLYGLPTSVQNLLLYNPLVHTIELSRKSLFPLYHIGEVNLIYPSAVALIIFSGGICFFQAHRHHLTMR